MKKEQLIHTEVMYGLKTQVEAVRHFIQKMDIGMLELLLVDKNYQGLPKKVFLEKLELAFAIFKLNHNDELDAWSSSCCVDTCMLEGKKGYIFTGKHTPYFLPLIIRIRDGIVENIYECENLRRDHHQQENIPSYRVYINDFDLKTGEDITDFPF